MCATWWDFFEDRATRGVYIISAVLISEVGNSSDFWNSKAYSKVPWYWQLCRKCQWSEIHT